MGCRGIGEAGNRGTEKTGDGISATNGASDEFALGIDAFRLNPASFREIYF
jgi:hypothetical protein